MFNSWTLKTTMNGVVLLGGSGMGIHYLSKNSGTSYSLLYDKDALLLTSSQEYHPKTAEQPKVKDTSSNKDSELPKADTNLKSSNEGTLPSVGNGKDSSGTSDTEPKAEKLTGEKTPEVPKEPTPPEPKKETEKQEPAPKDEPQPAPVDDKKDDKPKKTEPTNSIWKQKRGKTSNDNLFSKDKVDTYIIAKLRQPLDKTNYPKKPLYDNATTTKKTATKSRNFTCAFVKKRGGKVQNFPFCDIQTLNMPPETKYKELSNINNNAIYADNFDDFSYYTIVLEKSMAPMAKVEQTEKIVIYSTQEELTANSVYGELDFLFKVKIDKKSKAVSPIDQSIKHFLVEASDNVKSLINPSKCKLNGNIDLSKCKIFDVSVTQTHSDDHIESFDFKYDPKTLTSTKMEKGAFYLVELEKEISVKTLAKGANAAISIFDDKNKELTKTKDSKFAFVAEKNSDDKTTDPNDYLFSFA